MISCSKFEYKEPCGSHRYIEPISEDYKVFVDGEEVPVYTCRISKYPFNRCWPGYQRDPAQSELASFVNIVADENVKIEVLVNREYERILIKPYSKKIAHTEKDGKVCFELPVSQDAVLEADSYHGCLYIFNSKPIACENPDEVTHYFGPGIHMVGKIELHDDESVYLDKDALVFGEIFAENAKNLRIFGNGVFDNSHEARFCGYCYEKYTNGNMKFYECENISIEGVLMKDSAIWCVNLFHCFNVIMDDIKVFGQWRYNTDGVDIVNCQNIVLKNSFIHSFDDTVTIKGIARYARTDNKDIHIDNCILWCDWGKCCEIGIETICREYCDISFTNCDILRGGNACLDIQSGNCAEIHDIKFENINVEFNAFDTPEVYQESDEMVYNQPDTLAIPALIYLSTRRYAVYVPGCTERDIVNLDGIDEACVHDIDFKNINVFYDEKIPRENGKYEIKVVKNEAMEGNKFHHINIENITVNGEPFEIDANI